MPKIAVSLALLLALAPGLAQAQSPGLRALAAGRDAIASGDLEAGIGRLAEAAALLDPVGERSALAAAYLELGRAYAERPGEELAALIALRRSAAFAELPGDARALAELVARRLGRVDGAEELARPAEPAPGQQGSDGAFGHFFGARPAAAPEPPTVRSPEAATAPPVALTPSPGAAAAPTPPNAAPVPKAGAFEHFFGARRPPAPPPTPTPAPTPAPSADAPTD